MRPVYFCVQWFGSAPLGHPGFKTAYEIEPNTFRMEFPAHWPGVSTSRRAQRNWADQKVQHLRSWGIQGNILDMPEREIRK